MSLQQPDSELSRLNLTPPGRWIDVAPETAEVLRLGQSLATQSELAFNPVFRSNGDAATAFQVKHVVSGFQARRIESCVIDLSGIAKGYAVDRAVELLLKAGAREILVNAGGDMRHAGCRPMQINVRHAADPFRHAGVVMLCGEALASSTTRVLTGDGLAAAAGVVDGSGRVLPAGRGATVIAASAMLADVLAKVVLIDAVRGEAMLQHYAARRVVMPEALFA